ncbi:MAG TPA: hypothetical protein VM141_01100 [Planctomycetota bacterium]|nr:hypothetical protein [Planctomycetota bacterium]
MGELDMHVRHLGKHAVLDNANGSAISTFPAPVAAPIEEQAGIRSQWFPVDRFLMGALWFHGAGADGGTFTYDVLLHYPVHKTGRGYVPRLIASGTATLSTYTAAVPGVATASDRLADTLTDDSGKSLAVVSSPANNTPAELSFDTMAAGFVEVRTRLGTATKASAILMLGNASGFFTLRRLLAGSMLPAGKGLADVLGGFSGDGGSDITSSAFAAMQAMAQWNDWRLAYKVIPCGGTGNVNAFTVVAPVEYELLAVCRAPVGLAFGNVSLGYTGAVTELIGDTADSAFLAGEIWKSDATATLKRGLSSALVLGPYVVGADTAIVFADGGGNGLIIDLMCRWRPLRSAAGTTGSVVAA